MWRSRIHRARQNALRKNLRLKLKPGLEKLEDRSLLAAITGGNLVVERIGNGTTTLSNAAFQVAAVEYARTGGAAVQTIELPSSLPNPVTDSGSATSNGYLNVYNGLVGIPGYNSVAGTAGVAALNTKVGTVIGSDGNLASRTLFPTSGTIPFAGNNFRSMIPTGSNTFYATGTGSGTSGGVWYANGSAFTQISTTVTNARNVEIYNNQLYFSTGSGTPGIYSVGSGLPTATGQTSTAQISTGTGSNPYGFVLFDTDGNGAIDRAYIADERTSAGGGLQKWTFNGTSWTSSWSLLVNGTNQLSATAGSGFAGLRGLSGSFSNGVATLYATTSEATNNRMISIVDSGSTPTSATAIASAGANYVFRGLDLVPDNTPPLVTSIDDGDIDNEVTVGNTMTYTITFNEAIDASTVGASDFDNSGTANITVGTITALSPTVFTVQITPTTTGTLILRIPTGAVIKDAAGNNLATPVLDDTTVNVISGGDTTPPSVVSIVDDDADNLVALNQLVTYTISFSEDIDAASVTASDFDNASSASITIGTITETSPGVFSVQVTPTSGSDIKLQINGTIKDVAGNDLIVPVLDDDTLTVDAIAPTVTNITHTSAASISAETPVTYTVTFSEDIDASSVSASDFSNAGTASIVVGAITEPSPGVFTVILTPTSAGTLLLRIPSGAIIKDIAGNNAAVPVDDDQTITVTPITPLGPGDIVVLGYNTAGSPADDSLVIMTFVELVGGTQFIVSDNEIAADGGTSFADLNEAEAVFKVKTGQTIPAGTIITLPWGGADVSTSTYDWDLPGGSIGLGNNNDEIYLYKALSTADITPSTFIYGVAIGTSTSARPNGLSLGTSFIRPTGAAARYKPVGAVYSGLPSTLRPAIGNTAANWESIAPGSPGWNFSIGPTFTSAVVNGGVAFPNNSQRSIVTSLVVNFGSPVVLQSNPFSLENIGLVTAGSSFIPQNQLIISPSSGASSSFTVTFDAGSVANGAVLNGVVKRSGGPAASANGNSLADGNYVLRIDPSKVKGEGFSLVGDAAFGDVATDSFFRMYGDSDGDGDVDGTDAVALRNAQLSYNAALDWDGNGSVTAGADINNFNSNRNRRRRSI